MAMVKIGKTYYSGQPKDVYLICGNAVRDGETFDAKGNDLGKVTVAGMQLYARVLDTADGLPTIAEAVSREFERIAEALANAE